MQRIKSAINVNYIIQVLLFAFVVVIDNARSIGFLGKWQNGSLSLGIGAVVFGIIITHYGLTKLKKIPLVLYSLLCLLLLVTCKWFFYRIPGLYYGQCLMLVLNLWFGGIAVFLLLRNKPAIPKNMLFYAWLIFMLLACISRYHTDLPLYQIVVFGLFYLPVFDENNRKQVLSRMGTGIVLGFWGLQAIAYGFRPFDSDQYKGLYYNCNLYAMLCMVVIFFSVSKLFEAEQKRNWKWIAFWTVEMFAVYGLLILNIGRAAILVTTIGLFIVVLLNMRVLGALKWKNVIGRALFSGICVLVMVPVMYATVRFAPTILTHPIWFGDEYVVGEVIESGAAIDDERYTTFSRWLYSMSKRVYQLWGDNTEYVVKTEEGEKIILDPEYATRKYYVDENFNAIQLRKGIALSFLTRLNLLGHTPSEHIMWVTPYDQVEHAHNIIVQMFFSYGLFAGIAFLAWIVLCAKESVQFAKRNTKEWYRYLPLLMWLIIIGYGVMDCVWQFGQITWTIFLIMQVFLFDGKEKADGKNT